MKKRANYYNLKNGGFIKMGEQARAELSVFFRLDSGIVEHNNREFIAKSIVRERMPDNITYKRENIREFTLYYSN